MSQNKPHEDNKTNFKDAKICKLKTVQNWGHILVALINFERLLEIKHIVAFKNKQ